MVRRWALWLDLAVKAALVGLLLFAVARPDLPQFHGKAMVARALLYPISALIVPVVWWLRRRPRPWDDLNHFVNWFLLLWGIGLLLFPSAESVRRPFVTVLTIVGTGALLAVLWEVGEWFVFLRAGVEVERLYQDTLGDEVLGTTGALLSALLVLWWRRRAPGLAAAR